MARSEPNGVLFLSSAGATNGVLRRLHMSRPLLVAVVTIASAIVAWWIGVDRLGLLPANSFPSVAETVAAFLEVSTKGYAEATLWKHCLHSLALIVCGFGLACLIALPLGVAMACSRTVNALVNPVFLLLRPIPPLAWIPLAILWLGLGDAAKILVIVCGAFPPALINTVSGIRGIEPALIDAARMLGTPPLRLAAKVLVPAALPSIFTGLRIALQATWTSLVAAELVGSLAGLGHILNSAQQDIYPAMILVSMITVAILGWACTFLLELLERQLTASRQSGGRR